MPELPEVMRTGESLHRHLAGKKLIRFQIKEGSRYYMNPFSGSELLITGLLLINVTVKAKRILFLFFNEKTSQYIILISFLGMEGHWIRQGGKHSGIILEMGEIKKMGKHTVNIIQETFYFDDVRHFGSFLVCTTQEELNDVFKNVGPDFMTGNITLDQYREKIKGKHIEHKEICWYMLEQKYFSGIGNYLKSEILYMSGIAPMRTLGTLTEDEIQRLYYWSIAVIRESYENYGLTIATYVDPDGNLGMYNPRVYQKTTDPTGLAVRKDTLSDKRGTYWCPQRQF